jgi:hypothetical protein
VLPDVGLAALTSIKAIGATFADSARLLRGETQHDDANHPHRRAITAAFAVFVLTLWRAERMTRDLKRE